MSPPIVIIGAGLSGLCCAKQLSDHKIPVLVLEATNRVGGRIKTDVIDGFQLDHGFQVFLTSYPEAQSMLNFQELNLHRFRPGAMVRFQGRFQKLIDPWRDPWGGFASVFQSVGSLRDKWLIARLRSHCLRGTIDSVWHTKQQSSMSFLRDFGFSEGIIQRFFIPFLGGIFLDPSLNTTSSMLQFVFRMFSTGAASLPEKGMAAIPEQIASKLPPNSIRFQARVKRIDGKSLWLETGERIEADRIVVATHAPAAAELLSASMTQQSGTTDESLATPAFADGFQEINTRARGTMCFYFGAERSPHQGKLLILNGDSTGPINSLAVLSDVAPRYAPPGRALISVSVQGANEQPIKQIPLIQTQLTEWFGPQTEKWTLLKAYSIPYALPDQTAPALNPPERQVRFNHDLYVCGDHRDQASIQGAMASGRRVAEIIRKDRESDRSC